MNKDKQDTTTESTNTPQSCSSSKINEYKLATLIVFVIFIATVMTVVSVYIYTKSGAIQLDLSRPGYESVRKELSKDQKKDQNSIVPEFSSSGILKDEDFSEFIKQYDSALDRARDMNAFGGDSLNQVTVGDSAGQTDNKE